MKKIITCVFLVIATTSFSQEEPSSTMIRRQCSVGLKTRFPSKGATQIIYGHFGYIRKLDVRPEIFFSSSCFIVPNNLRLDLELPFNIFLADHDIGVYGGISAGLVYQFLGKSSLGIHPMIGTSIKRYFCDNESITVVPLTIGVNYQKRWFGIECTYNRFLQNRSDNFQLYKSAIDLSLSYLFGKKEPNNSNPFKKDKAWEIGVGLGTLGAGDHFIFYSNIGLNYHLNSDFEAMMNIQVFGKSDCGGNAPVAMILDLVKTWTSKGFLRPDLGISIGYANEHYEGAGLQYGFVGGVRFVAIKAPRFSFKSGFRLLSTPDKYKHYHFNAMHFNILQVSYRL